MDKLLVLFLIVCSSQMFSLSVSFEDANRIGERIWKNECGSTIEGLTHWNKGENFPSFGIGHFIWYPVGVNERFEETFPLLLKFFQKEGVIMPHWLKTAEGCPWKTREDFTRDKDESKMKELRAFLLSTKALQAIFIANRLEDALPQLLEHCSKADLEKIRTLFLRLSKDAKGLYALIDYVNFKGSGISPGEIYKGQGWGLLQVLQRISITTEQPLDDFVKAAKSVLIERVQNSPPERNEQRWLKGWMNRLDTYLVG